MDPITKRKAPDSSGGDEKRAKTKRQWRVPRSGDRGPPQTIQPGDSGIWVTCNKGKEGKCVGEVRDLLREYAEILYPHALESDQEDHDDGQGAEDIESAINAEIKDMKKPGSARLFSSIKISVPCVMFFKTIAPVEPVSLVKKICEDAMENPNLKRTRFAKRLSPMTLIGRASSDGLEKVAKEVLKPHFHQEPFQRRKFAIRPTLRNHNTLTRDSIIKQIASLVGHGHEVDLKNYELLIVVEVYQNVCGMSVVDASFERLKRYNIAEIFDPTPVEPVKREKQSATEDS